MPWPEDALTQDETIVTSFRQHWKLLIIPIGWFILSVVIVLLAFSWFDWPWLRWAVVVVVVGGAIWFVVRPIVSWATTRYVLTTERLITRRGLVAKSGVEIPLERITNVNFSQSVFERMLGAGDLLVESAGTGGQSRFSNIPHPDDFASLLYKVREERSVSLQGRPQTAPAAAPEAPSDATERLQRLKQLHSDGVLTDAEYEEKRAKLVGEI
ncbi:MAG: PH domain-containing protein [Actinomycetota bacterium]|nr:PH domain-containing protein [Actinomycetota bacterium]